MARKPQTAAFVQPVRRHGPGQTPRSQIASRKVFGGNRSSEQQRRKKENPAAFAASRTRDLEEGAAQFSASDDEDSGLGSDQSLSSASDNDEDHAVDSYSSLLQLLKPVDSSVERPGKRRKLEHAKSSAKEQAAKSQELDQAEAIEAQTRDAKSEELPDDEDDDTDEVEGTDSDDEATMLNDPFEQHYVNVTEEDLNTAIERSATRTDSQNSMVGNAIRKVGTLQKERGKNPKLKGSRADLNLKKKLSAVGKSVVQTLNAEELDVLYEIFGYRDVVYSCRNLQNTAHLRDITALHCLNHVLKTRDKVLKNNAKIAQENDGDADHRDQGFTRPKVLFLVPTKQACVRFVESIVKITEPDQQENRGRFMDIFSLPGDDSFENKPEDFREVFGGNHEEDFRVGLKFTRKTIKFFSGFYNSDIILASPLGLMRTITTGGKKDNKTGHDADFLSSIEIVVMDNSNALEMQNWQHVDYVFSQLNLMPKESHGCDFARVRSWYLDGKAKHLRQTIIFSNYLTPSISALATTYLHNITGRVKYTPVYVGAMINLSTSIPFTLTQSFLRFDSPSPEGDSDSRFKFFTSTILPNLLRSSNKALNKGTLIFIPTYLDFVRLRNHFSTAAEATSLAFGTISEYSTPGDVARARSHFLSGRHSVLLYSERAHHYFRYKLKGVRKLIFYGLPDNPVFWNELIESLGTNAQVDIDWAQSQRGKQGKGLVRAMFSKWDVMKLERIVGTDRIGRLMNEKEGEVFDFV